MSKRLLNQLFALSPNVMGKNLRLLCSKTIGLRKFSMTNTNIFPKIRTNNMLISFSPLQKVCGRKNSTSVFRPKTMCQLILPKKDWLHSKYYCTRLPLNSNTNSKNDLDDIDTNTERQNKSCDNSSKLQTLSPHCTYNHEPCHKFHIDYFIRKGFTTMLTVTTIFTITGGIIYLISLNSFVFKTTFMALGLCGYAVVSVVNFWLTRNIIQGIWHDWDKINMNNRQFFIRLTLTALVAYLSVYLFVLMGEKLFELFYWYNGKRTAKTG